MPTTTDEQWQAIRDHVGDGQTEDEWQEAVRWLPPGAIVEGTVLACLPMGIWISLGERLAGQVEVVSIIDEKRPLFEDDWPAVGSTVPAMVLECRAEDQRDRLTIKPSDLTSK